MPSGLSRRRRPRRRQNDTKQLGQAPRSQHPAPAPIYQTLTELRLTGNQDLPPLASHTPGDHMQDIADRLGLGWRLGSLIRLRGEVSALSISDGGKVFDQPLRASLVDMQRNADGAHRGNTVSCQLRREHYRGTLAERIAHVPSPCNVYSPASQRRCCRQGATAGRSGMAETITRNR